MSKLHLGVPVSEYTPPAYEWLIDYRFPLKRVVGLGGPEKSGKSQFVSRLAAAVTNPEVELAPNVRVNESGNVVIFSTERTDEYFARIEVAGADTARVRIVNAERGYDFERIIADIENINPESNVRLIPIDHIGDLSEKEIRSVAKVGDIITRLTTQAMRLRCCILMITHTVKNASNATRPQQTFGGAVAWVRKWSDAFGICPIKHGVGVIEHVIGSKRRFETCWEYRITGKVSRIKDDKGQPIESELLTIEGNSPVSYLEAFNQSEASGRRYVSKFDKAKDLLRQALADGDLPSTEIFEMTAPAGISERTVWSAVKELGIVTSGGPGSKWTLPKPANSANASPDEPLQSLQSLQPPEAEKPAETCHYTPKEVMDAIHEVFGPCARDVASPPVPVHVQCLKWYAIERGEDGLKLSWKIPDDGHSFLFLNGPWSREAGKPYPIPLWTDKLLAERALGNVPRAIVLVPFRGSNSFDKIKDAGAAIINLRWLKFGGASGRSYYQTACCLLGFDKAEVDALVASLLRHGVSGASVLSYGLD